MTSIPPEELARAGTTLMRSSTVTNAVKWLLVAVLLPGAGWVIAKLDTKEDIAAIRLSVDRLTTQQVETVSRLDKSIPAVNQRVDALQRDIALAMVAARAYETERVSRAKLDAANRIVAERYDPQIKALVAPAAAARNVYEGAVPYSTR